MSHSRRFMRGAVILSMLAAVLGPASAGAADTAKCKPGWAPKDFGVDIPCETKGKRVPVRPVPSGGSSVGQTRWVAVKAPCELSGVWEFCLGKVPCRYSVWHWPQPLPTGAKPKDARPWVRMCQDARQSLGSLPKMSYLSVWRTPAQVGAAAPPLIVQARQAMGHLRLPRVGLAFNPPGQTLVGLDTWWWATGAKAAPVRSTSVWGLVAVAEPTGLAIDSGDGSDAVQCPWTTSKDAAERDCYSAYVRASVAGPARYKGRPAYLASVTPTWTVRFDNHGTPVTFPGLDVTVPGPTTRTPVPVAEVQTIVTGSGS